LQVPGKLIEIMSFDKPILFIYQNDNSPSFNYIKDQPGIFITKNNVLEIKKTINLIIETKNKNWKRDIRKYYWENLFKKYKNII
jgi:hypothetical protein